MSTPKSALDGVCVLDLSRILAGPWCTQTLGDLGADVIKVERPVRGDDTRSWGPPFLSGSENTKGESAYYLCANRNKRSITCDIARPEGQEIIRKLVRHSHVFIENFKVGGMARYGLDYPSLKAINPGLVYCSITGYGQTGTYSQQAGYDYAMQALGGLMSVTGESDAAGGSPQKVGVAVADLFNGVYATVAILAALRHAERTGEGQYIDMALLDTQIAMLSNLGANYLVSGQNPVRLGNAHANIVPYQVFEVAPAKDAKRDYLVLAVGNDTQFARFCKVSDRAAWIEDDRFKTNAKRVLNRAILIPLIQIVLFTRTKAEWLSQLTQAQVPCSPINTIAEAFASPHIQARQLLDNWAHPQQNKLSLVASPLHLSATPVHRADNYGTPPPLLGQHTKEVLKSLLQYDDAHIKTLQTEGVI